METNNLEVIVHPAIAKLIQVKWDEFGRYWPRILSFLTFESKKLELIDPS